VGFLGNAAVLGVAASVVGHAMVADWFAPLLVLTRHAIDTRSSQQVWLAYSRILLSSGNASEAAE
jgi:hypothetical protein